jgi:uncharacterized membrane protein YdjX (TVP38/TMEM64 family)
MLQTRHLGRRKTAFLVTWCWAAAVWQPVAQAARSKNLLTQLRKSPPKHELSPAIKKIHTVTVPPVQITPVVVTTVSTAELAKATKRMQLAIASTAGVLFLFALYYYRHVILPFLDSKRIQSKTLAILETMKPADPQDTWKSLLVYAAGMAAWELLGLSTIPVETTAAMVFGWPAFLPSAVGKLVGALVAFLLGRTILAGWAKQRLATNRFFQLLEGEPLHAPLTTAFLMKYSCFPESVKNFGSSLVSRITPGMFVFVTVVHGWSFTALWTWLGVESATNLVGTKSLGLRIAMALTFVIGFVVSPLLMAWWIRDLKQHADKNLRDVQLRVVPAV